MKNLVQKLKPYRHGLIPIVYGIFYMICFVYLEQRPVQQYHIIHTALDNGIPFCEFFIVPYYLWFAYVGISVVAFVFLDKEKQDFWKLCITLGTGMTLFLVISYFYPNTLQLRPETFARDNIFVTLAKGIYTADTPTNVFPSIHCYNSMAVNAAICHSRIMNQHRGVVAASKILCISIILSTVFVKQHSIIDVIGAFILFVLLYIPLYVRQKNKAAYPGANPARETL